MSKAGSASALLALAMSALPSGSICRAAETCRYDGRTSYDGRLAVAADVTRSGRAVTVDVRLRLDAHPLPLFNTHYLMEEISTADAGGVERVAVNNRYSVDAHIVRQQWDVFDRAADGLRAHRIEGKRAAQFARQHPGFARFWDPGTFGQPWLDAFDRASPERRPDLDLRPTPVSVRPPLALAFYWLRWLPQTAVVPVFLPGFKDEKLVDLAIGTADVAGRTTRVAPLHYPELSTTAPSTASAWLAPGRQLLQLAFDLRGVEHSATAVIRVLGCSGSP